MKNNKMILLGFAMIFLFSLSTFANSSLNTTSSYVVKQGDKKTFKITSYSAGSNTSYTEPVNWDNGSTGTVTFKQGMTFDVAVFNVSTDGQTCFLQESLNGAKVKPEQAQFVDYVNPVAPNSTYYQNLANSNSTLYQLKGNIFTISLAETLLNKVYSFVYSYDITTGWTTTFKVTESFANGTTISKLQVDQGSGGIPGFEVIPTLVFFSVLTPVVLIYRKKRVS